MRTTERLTWVPTAPAPDDAYFASLGAYTFEIGKSHAPDVGYVLELWQVRPEDTPLVVWAIDGFSLEEVKARAECLADERVPFTVQD
jgi:hypothetical protein